MGKVEGIAQTWHDGKCPGYVLQKSCTGVAKAWKMHGECMLEPKGQLKGMAKSLERARHSPGKDMEKGMARAWQR
jgi:hypothetical protein